MLVLTRKSRQSIMIGDDVEIFVLSTSGDTVRIGVQAPRDVPVFRKEVYLEIRQQNGGAGAWTRAEIDEALKGRCLSTYGDRRATNERAAVSGQQRSVRPRVPGHETGTPRGFWMGEPVTDARKPSSDRCYAVPIPPL